MLRSIRWRLVLSYLSLTLLTVTAIGLLSYSLIQRNIATQERDALRSSAQVVARQAEGYMSPNLQMVQLNELAHTSAYLANMRVRILSSRGTVLADSGSPYHIDRMIWLDPADASRVQVWLENVAPELGAYMLTLSTGENRGLLMPHELSQDMRGMMDPGVKLQEFILATGPWGSRLVFEESEGRERASTPRSSQVVQATIGKSDQPLGTVQILESPSYRAAAMESFLTPFLAAAGGALFLSAIVGLWIGHHISSPIIQLSQTAGKMGAGDLSARAPNIRGDEIGQLGTELNSMAERLENSFVQLADERDNLRRFITDASHELRTPITALRNFLEIMSCKTRMKSKTRSEFLSDSLHQVERLEWITHNLLNLSRLDAGITALNHTRFDAIELLKTVMTPFEGLADRKQITLQSSMPDEELMIEADRSLLELALSNLLDNALKFTPPGGWINMNASLSEGTIHFQVEDNGPGIPAEDLSHIFERFYRGKHIEAEGSGLGLALVKSVIEAHGGTIEAQSEHGKGSRFMIHLPCTCQPDLKTKQQEPSSGV
jgi:signal transduction histidine kinase